MNDRDRSFHLSPVQIVASAAASVTAAVLASFFGVAGTVIGAGVMSAAASVGNAVYSYWLRSTHRAIRETIPSALRQPGSTVRTLVGAGARVAGTSSGGADGPDADPDNTNEVPALDSSPDLPPPGSPGPPPSPLGRPPTAPGPAPSPPGGEHGRRGLGRIDELWPAALRVARSLRWRNIAVATAVVFGLTMASVTVVEALAKKPLSGIVGGSSPAGATTSLGGLVSGGQSSKPTPTPPSTPSESTTTNPQTTTPGGSSTTTPSPSTGSTGPGGSTTTTTPSSPTTPTTSGGTTPGTSGSSSGATSSGSSSGTAASGTGAGGSASGGSSAGTAAGG